MPKYIKYLVPHDRGSQINIKVRTMNQIGYRDFLYHTYPLDSIDSSLIHDRARWMTLPQITQVTLLSSRSWSKTLPND